MAVPTAGVSVGWILETVDLVLPFGGSNYKTSEQGHCFVSTEALRLDPFHPPVIICTADIQLRPYLVELFNFATDPIPRETHCQAAIPWTPGSWSSPPTQAQPARWKLGEKTKIGRR